MSDATPATSSSDADVAPPAAPVPPRRSVLGALRDNRAGALTGGLVVAIVVGLLLSVLVPDDANVLALTLLGVLLAAAVGFTVRILSAGRILLRQVEAFVATVVGVHLMAITGLVGGDIPVLSDLGVAGPGFSDAMLVAFATPPVSTGGLLAGLAAAAIVGWRERASADGAADSVE